MYEQEGVPFMQIGTLITTHFHPVLSPSFVGEDPIVTRMVIPELIIDMCVSMDFAGPSSQFYQMG